MVELTDEKRQEMIDKIVQADVDYIMEAYHSKVMDIELVSNILEDGFKGYAHYTDEELISEFEERDFAE